MLHTIRLIVATLRLASVCPSSMDAQTCVMYQEIADEAREQHAADLRECMNTPPGEPTLDAEDCENWLQETDEGVPHAAPAYGPAECMTDSECEDMSPTTEDDCTTW